MAEFSATANLEIVPTGFGAARREIERELGDIEVSVAGGRPTGGGGGGAVGSRGPEPAGVDLSRRQLGQQETLVDLAGERNELLEELVDDGVGGGGGGGGFGLGFASRGILGGVAAGAGGAAGLTGLLSAARLGGGAFSPGIFGRGGVGEPGELGPGGPGDPISQGFANLITQFTGIEQVGDQPGPQGLFENITGFFGDLGIPEGGTVDRPGGAPPESPVGEGITAETGDGGPGEANINVDGRVQINGMTEPEIRNTVQNLWDEFVRDLSLEFGGGTGTRTGGGGGGTNTGKLRR